MRATPASYIYSKIMKTCDLCGKGSKMVGNRILLRGHYNPTNWTRKYPNLQKATSPDGKKVTACAKCIRGFSKADRLVTNRVNRADLARRRAEKSKEAALVNTAKQKKANLSRQAQAKAGEARKGTPVKKDSKEKASKKDTKKKATK